MRSSPATVRRSRGAREEKKKCSENAARSKRRRAGGGGTPPDALVAANVPRLNGVPKIVSSALRLRGEPDPSRGVVGMLELRMRGLTDPAALRLRCGGDAIASNVDAMPMMSLAVR